MAAAPPSPPLPLVDLQEAASSRAAFLAAAEIIRVASRDVGFFAVTGHGVPPAALSRAASASKAFFAKPTAEKMRVAANGEAYGFFPM